LDNDPLRIGNLSKLEKLELLSNLINELKEDFIAKKEQIPVSIFNGELSSLETIVKFLKENRKLRNNEISSLLGRGDKTVWITYKNSKKKMPEKFKDIKHNITIPVSILKDRSLSVLENLVVYLKENYNFSFKKISLLIRRNNKTVWTVFNRAKKKRLSQSKGTIL
jgi:hypothetical protein